MQADKTLRHFNIQPVAECGRLANGTRRSILGNYPQERMIAEAIRRANVARLKFELRVLEGRIQPGRWDQALSLEIDAATVELDVMKDAR